METLKQINNKEQVLILIGKKIKGSSNLHKPIKSIILIDAEVLDVHKKIEEFLENESWNFKRHSRVY